MKTKHLLIIPAFLIACIANAFEFYSTNKAASYTIETISDQLTKEYKTPYIVYAVLVAATSTIDNSYKNQFAQLAELEAESLSLIYISATTNEEATSGYHTTAAVAQSILNGGGFQVAVYSPEGKVLIRSGSVLLASQISMLVKEHNKSINYAPTAPDALPRAGY